VKEVGSRLSPFRKIPYNEPHPFDWLQEKMEKPHECADAVRGFLQRRKLAEELKPGRHV
jgi:hypothetical protein